MVQVPGACRSQYDVAKNIKCCFPAIITLSQYSHLQYLRLPDSSVNISCTVENETPNSSAITLIVVLLSLLTMPLPKSLMEPVTTSGWPLLKSSSIDPLPCLKRKCHLYPKPGLHLSYFPVDLIIHSVSVGDLFRATQNFTVLRNSMSPFDFMTFSVTTVATREKHFSFPGEQIILNFSGNDFVTANYRLTFPRFFTLS